MFDPLLRPVKDRALAPLARAAGDLHPHLVTAASLASGIAAAAAAWAGAWGVGLILWIACRILDGLDGLIAREQGSVSDLGGFFDLVSDFIVYAAIPLAIALRPGAPDSLLAWTAILLGTFYVNTAAWMVPAALLERRRARESGSPTSIEIPEGLVSGGETVLFYLLFFLIPSQQLLLVQTMAVLTAITVVQRILWAVRAFGPSVETTPDPGTPRPTSPSSPSPDRPSPDR
ncbi:MAG: CDP-alcohol phosphatidyltransferase family protein [Longimicrobiales bacterium]|nr:CDP-alcohol phosphatidyltransferase family protein [Longimicrobiales bacterium]